MLLGYIRDTSSHSVLSALGVYDSADSSRDATRVVVWQPDASRVELIEYDGESARLDTVPTVPTLSVALRP
jgi:hypothetical protein